MTFSLPRGGAMGPRFGDNASSRLDRRGDRGSSAASRARRAGSNSRAIVALAAAPFIVAGFVRSRLPDRK